MSAEPCLPQPRRRIGRYGVTARSSGWRTAVAGDWRDGSARRREHAAMSPDISPGHRSTRKTAAMRARPPTHRARSSSAKKSPAVNLLTTGPQFSVNTSMGAQGASEMTHPCAEGQCRRAPSEDGAPRLHIDVLAAWLDTNSSFWGGNALLLSCKPPSQRRIIPNPKPDIQTTGNTN
jgi:hypothetical protein